MELNSDKLRELLQGQVRAKIVNLYKQCLIILEDYPQSNYNSSKEVYQKARKRILDCGNDTIREIEETLKNFDINLKG
jgi:hypothetical protein